MKHALLLVGTKVLAVCGRSPQLPTADTLMLILVAANRYYHTHLIPTTPNTQGGYLFHASTIYNLFTLSSLSAPEDSLGVASAAQDPPTFSTDEDMLQSDLNSTRGRNETSSADGGIDSSSSESGGNKVATVTVDLE